MSLPKYKEVTHCPMCNAQRLPCWAENHTSSPIITIRCGVCEQDWDERIAPTTPPIEQGEPRSLRVERTHWAPGDSSLLSIHGDQVGSRIGVNAAERLRMEPGQTGTLTWTPDKQPEPVFAVQHEETERYWACSACGERLCAPWGRGLHCPHCKLPFNADPKHLE